MGIGDINSTFLPKLEPMTPGLPQDAPQPLKATPAPNPVAPINASSPLVDDALSLPGGSDNTLTFDEEKERTDIVKNDLLTRNHEVLDQQLEERPLAKRQEELQVEAASSSTPSPAVNGHPPTVREGAATPPAKPTPRKALLKNDDIELTRVQNVRRCSLWLPYTHTYDIWQLLDEVHRRFFVAYGARGKHPNPQKDKAAKRRSKSAEYDVRVSNLLILGRFLVRGC